MAELADAHDSKSCEGDLLRVRLPPSASGAFSFIYNLSALDHYNVLSLNVNVRQFFSVRLRDLVDARARLGRSTSTEPKNLVGLLACSVNLDETTDRCPLALRNVRGDWTQ